MRDSQNFDPLEKKMSHSINVAVLNFPTDVVIKKLSRK
jgi:hypothetical protein